MEDSLYFVLVTKLHSTQLGRSKDVPLYFDYRKVDGAEDV